MFATKIIAKIIKNTTNNLFIYPGGTIAPLLDECKKENVNLVVAKNEQGAGYMAIAEAQLNHKPSFLAVTSGPGATNIITIIADAYYDSIPLIILTGQVGTTDLNRSQNIRQRGFQEVPIINMVKDITKAVYQPHTVEEFSEAIHEAYTLSNSGRKGPVLIDMPMNIQLQKITTDELKTLVDMSRLVQKNETYPSIQEALDKSINVINSSLKPLILIGGGAQEDWEVVRNFAIQTKIPTISTLRGLGVINSSNLYGWIGHTGMPWANKALFEADTVIVLGSRLDIRQTGSEIACFESKNIIHVDIDKNELKECRLKNTLQIHSSVKSYIKKLESVVLYKQRDKWFARLADIKKEMYLDDKGKTIGGINPKELLSYVDNLIGDKYTFISTGVGSHQHWVARYFNFDNKKMKLFTSAGHGTMGFGLPTALGLQYLQKDANVLCIDGDGSFQLNIQELALVQELHLNLKILILDNSRLGIVSQFQNITFGDDPTTGNFKNPNFFKIANAYGIESYFLESMNKDTIKSWFFNTKAALLHVKIKHDAPLSPMLLGGQKLDEMWYNEHN